jgi:6-phosphogluconate dehydrogenase
MVGGTPEAVAAIAPALDTLSPPDGWLHVGPSGSGHFTKMVHNGIEYGLMQAYAEGFEILQASDFDLDEGAIAHLWNQGSVVRSWLLELLVAAYRDDPSMESVTGWVEDSGEGRWTMLEAIEKAVPAPVLAMSLIMRFRSRQPDTYSGKVLASLRSQFGGHSVQKAAPGRDVQKAER